jgi:hypothetical protein
MRKGSELSGSINQQKFIENSSELSVFFPSCIEPVHLTLSAGIESMLQLLANIGISIPADVHDCLSDLPMGGCCSPGR